MINRVLFYNSGGGIGDAIQILPLINSLKKEFKNANFYYLCAHDNHFNDSLKGLNSHIDTIDMSNRDRIELTIGGVKSNEIYTKNGNNIRIYFSKNDPFKNSELKKNKLVIAM